MKLFFSVLFTTVALTCLAGTGTIAGKIFDKETNEKIPFANVFICKGPEKAAIAVSDIEGRFTVSILPGSYTVVVSYLGYKKDSTLNVLVQEDKTTSLEIKLSPASIELSECLIVTGGIPAEYYKLSCSSIKITTDEIKVRGSRKYKLEKGKSITNESSHGTLTAGEINDFSKWKLWEGVAENDLKAWQSTWKVKPLNRYAVSLVYSSGHPVIDREVQLVTEENKMIWTARTDNTGKAELWAGCFNDSIPGVLKLRIKTINGFYTGAKPFQFGKGKNHFELEESCHKPDTIDLVFAVDATGSMGDEISYLKSDLLNIIERLQKKVPGVVPKLGSVFYRDKGDEYVTRLFNLTSDIKKTIEFIQVQNAGGGGDFPEAPDLALEDALANMQWTKNARARIIFLILDAPPHGNDKIESIIRSAAEKGVRIVPVTCSGIDKSTEYLMRSLALGTNGTYIYLTDDSGVGGSHIKPSTDKIDPGKLNERILSVIHAFSWAPNCYPAEKEESISDKEVRKILLQNITGNKKGDKTADTLWQSGKEDKKLKYYPNPCKDILTIEPANTVGVLFLTDMHGKILEKTDCEGKDELQVDLSSYATGIYYLRYQVKKEWKSGKVILIR